MFVSKTVYVVRDSDGAPLYVGVTKNPKNRISTLGSKSWWGEAFAVETFRTYPEAAHEAERILIAALRPKYNRAGISSCYIPPTRNNTVRQGARRKAEYGLLQEIFRLGLAGAFDASDEKAA